MERKRTKPFPEARAQVRWFIITCLWASFAIASPPEEEDPQEQFERIIVRPRPLAINPFQDGVYKLTLTPHESWWGEISAGAIPISLIELPETSDMNTWNSVFGMLKNQPLLAEYVTPRFFDHLHLLALLRHLDESCVTTLDLRSYEPDFFGCLEVLAPYLSKIQILFLPRQPELTEKLILDEFAAGLFLNRFPNPNQMVSITFTGQDVALSGLRKLLKSEAMKQVSFTFEGGIVLRTITSRTRTEGIIGQVNPAAVKPSRSYRGVSISELAAFCAKEGIEGWRLIIPELGDSSTLMRLVNAAKENSQ